jgi:hypothetical protein
MTWVSVGVVQTLDQETWFQRRRCEPSSPLRTFLLETWFRRDLFTARVAHDRHCSRFSCACLRAASWSWGSFPSRNGASFSVFACLSSRTRACGTRRKVGKRRAAEDGGGSSANSRRYRYREWGRTQDVTIISLAGVGHSGDLAAPAK